MLRRLVSCAVPFVLLVSAVACDGGGLPGGWRRTPDGTGPRVQWDVYGQPLPTIPLPNDAATWPDPSSPTGRRLNASLVVPTELEMITREHFDELDGWGTFAPISIPFDAPIDLTDLVSRQGGPDNFHESDFPDHAIYLIDLTTGLPALLDVNSGNFPYAVMRPSNYFDNDPRALETNLVLETVEEDANGNGVLDPGEDTDFDGVLDHPNTLDGRLGSDLVDTYDHMAWFYERETNTLILRPILPLEEARTYAVVVSDRLLGENGQPVRSSLEDVHHVTQTQALEPLPRFFAAHPELYGDLAGRGWEGVAFAWTFTTQSVTRDLDTIRDGLYGRGTMSRLATDYPPDVAPAPMQGGLGCDHPAVGSVYTAPGDSFRAVLQAAGGTVFGLDENGVTELVRSYENLDHVSMAFFEVPYFFTDPEHENLDDAWDMDYQTGRARLTREVVSMMIFVPRETPEHQQPFEPIVYMHGHGSNSAEVLVYGGLLVQYGHAIVAVNAHGHGLDADRLTMNLLRATFGGECIGGLVDAVLAGRARDLDGNGTRDSGVDYWTAYVFHTRDSVRQTVVDQLQTIRILRSFDGTRLAPPRTLTNSIGTVLTFDGDVNGDGHADVAGDFDGNGRPDVGGPDVRYRYAGGSLGGIVTAMMAGVEPAITSAAAVVPGGGLADVALRTENGSVLPAMILRVIGPLVVGSISAGPSSSTACASGDVSLRIAVPSLDNTVRTEFACLPADEVAGDDLLTVRNLSNGELGCAGATGGVPGAFRVPIPSDTGDLWVVEHYRHGRDLIHYGDCRWLGEPPTPDRVIETWESGNGTGDGNCATCARFETTTWEAGEQLVSPAAGFGLRRQTPDFRRLMSLAQIGLERGDPINYARRVFLDPVVAEDVAPHVRSELIAMTTGDPNVCIATGYALARATGVEAFLPPDAPDHLADFRAPASFAALHPGSESPNDVVLRAHAIEAIPRFERNPVLGGETFLADVDDLSDGLLFFAADAETQLPLSEGGVAPVRISPPLRWSRRSRPMQGVGEDSVWTYAAGERTSAVVSIYVIPKGIHGFGTFFDPTLGFDSAVYSFNLLGRYLSTDGEDIPYLSDPAGHHCLADSSCSYIH